MSRASHWRCCRRTAAPARAPQRPSPARCWMPTCSAQTGSSSRRHDVRGSHFRLTHAPHAHGRRECAVRAEDRRSAGGGSRAHRRVRAGRAVQRLRPEHGHGGAHRAAAAAWHHRHAVAGAREPELPVPQHAVDVRARVPAAAHRRRDRPRRYGRAALAEFRPVPLPAFRADEARSTDDVRLVHARAAAAAGLDIAGTAQRADPAARGAGGHPARPGHRRAHRDRRRAGHHPRRPARARDGGVAGARRPGGLVRLELHARLPAQARAHVSQPAGRSTRRRLPHHPVADRDRLRRGVRQGLDERQPGAAGIPPRALHRLHLRRRRRGVRPPRPAAAAHAVRVRRRPRHLSCHPDPGYLCASAGRQSRAHLLRVRVHQRGYGHGTAAGGRRAAAAGERWRQLGRDAPRRLRYSHGAVFTAQTHRVVVEHVAFNNCRYFLLAALACAPAGAQPADVAAAGFDLQRPEIVEFVNEVVSHDGLNRKDVRALLKEAQPQPKIIETMTRPIEKVAPWWEYRDHFLSAERIREGTSFWLDHKNTLEQISAQYQVPSEYLVAILGVETRYGRQTGRYRVLDALATLAFDYPPRHSYFREELKQFLLLAKENQLDPLTATGSYAGAMGAPQFMPSSYRRYAVDVHTDRRPDLWGDWDDILASVANYLRERGWTAGGPVLAETRLGPDPG